MQNKEKNPEISDKIYKLGFEVGYHRHSEIGWVAREYSILMDKAIKSGLKNPEKLYEHGKADGAKKKDSDLSGTESASMKKGRTPVVIDAAKENYIEKGYVLFKMPCLFKFPQCNLKSHATDIPEALRLFKVLRKK